MRKRDSDSDRAFVEFCLRYRTLLQAIHDTKDLIHQTSAAGALDPTLRSRLLITSQRLWDQLTASGALEELADWQRQVILKHFALDEQASPRRPVSRARSLSPACKGRLRGA